MNFEFQFQCSRKLYSDTFRSFWLGGTIGYHVGMLVLGIWGLYQLGYGERIGLGGFCLGLAAYHFYSWLGYRRDYTAIPKELEGADIKVKVDDQGLRFESPFRITELPWKGIPWLKKYPELWIFGFDRSGLYYSAFPIATLSHDQKVFIESKVRENGGRVK